MKGKEGFLIIGFIIFTLFVFIPEIMFFQKGFLGGDYGQQFFPYSVWYAKNIKNLQFPSYTDLIGCGYNLFAEGQSGVFYPFNIILFFLFPVKIAYQLSPIIHFILGGIFSYIFMRNKNISIFGSLIFSLVFMFGANVCGIRYNTVVQKVLVWFPFSLYLIDKFFITRKYKYLFFTSFIFLLQLFAGFLQIAFYCISFSFLYFFIKIFIQKVSKKTLGVFILFIVFCFLFSLIQIIPTLKLVSVSTRSLQGLGFSLWGSSIPFVICTLIFPSWDYLVEGSIFIGIVLLPFLFLFFRYFKYISGDAKIFFFLFLISFIFALGKFTPILPLLIKGFHLYFIRKPSKFLFISTFFLASFVVFTLEEYLKRDFSKKDKQFILKALIVLLIIVLSIFILSNLFINIFDKEIIEWGKSYVKNHIWGKPYHRYSLDIYYQKVEGFFLLIKNCLSWKNPHNQISLLFLVILPFIFIFKKHFKKVFFSLIFIELFLFSQYATGLKGNFLSWSKFLDTPDYIKFLKNDKSDYRIYNFISHQTKNLFYENQFLLENKNIIYDIPSIGIYAPIIDKNYYDLLKDLGAVDDSLGRLFPTIEDLENNIGLLKFLNVKYIISAGYLPQIKNLSMVFDGKFKIYKIKDFLPQVFFASKVIFVDSKEKIFKMIKNKDYNPYKFVVVEDKQLEGIYFSSFRKKTIKILKKEPTYLKCQVKIPKQGFFVFTYNYLPGWHAFIDGEPTKIYRVNSIAMGILVKEGEHIIEFRFNKM
jgi:hypothetical protein